MCSQREYCIEVHINKFSINPWHGEESCLYMWKLCICIWCSTQYPCMCATAALLCSWHNNECMKPRAMFPIQREPCIQMHGSKSHSVTVCMTQRVMYQNAWHKASMYPLNDPESCTQMHDTGCHASMSITHRCHFLCARAHDVMTKNRVFVYMTLKWCTFCSWHNELYI
jgi:hypothetical protein